MAIASVLKQADIFYELKNSHLELIASVCRELIYGKGDLIFAEHTPGAELFVIASGEVNIEISPNDTPTVIATLRRGQSFGEVSLVDEGVRSATARAAQHNTHLVIVPRTQLMDLCDAHPDLGYLLMRNLAADLAMKIRNTDLAMRQQLQWRKE
jgi:CRP/FNR family transcriptional regulator, cyclic AMP receptor protein